MWRKSLFSLILFFIRVCWFSMPKRKREEFLLWDAIFPKIKEVEKKEKTDSWFSKNTMIEGVANECERCERFIYEGITQDHVETSNTKKMKNGNNDTFSNVKTRKVGLRPTKQQVITMETFFRCANHAYDLCVNLVKTNSHVFYFNLLFQCISSARSLKWRQLAYAIFAIYKRDTLPLFVTDTKYN